MKTMTYVKVAHWIQMYCTVQHRLMFNDANLNASIGICGLDGCHEVQPAVALSERLNRHRVFVCLPDLLFLIVSLPLLSDRLSPLLQNLQEIMKKT